MAAWRRAIELSLGETDLEKLRLIARSRTEAASRVERARILLGYWENSSFFAVGQALGLHHQTVQRCVERAVVEDPTMIALGLAGSLRSRWKRKPGWHRCRAGRRRNWVIRTNCGPRGCSPAMLASTVPPKGTRAWQIWRRARCARSSILRK